MKKTINKYAKDTLTLGVTGIGLGIASSISGGAAVAPLSKGIGTVGSVVALTTSIDLLNDSIKKTKRKY